MGWITANRNYRAPGAHARCSQLAICTNGHYSTSKGTRSPFVSHMSVINADSVTCPVHCRHLPRACNQCQQCYLSCALWASSLTVLITTVATKKLKGSGTRVPDGNFPYLPSVCQPPWDGVLASRVRLSSPCSLVSCANQISLEICVTTKIISDCKINSHIFHSP